jgi:hypothetical protein
MKKLLPQMIIILLAVACTPTAEFEPSLEDDVYIHNFESIHARFWAANGRAEHMQTVEEMAGPIAQLNGLNRELNALEVPIRAMPMHAAAVEFMASITAAHQNVMDAGAREETTRLLAQGASAFEAFEAHREAYYSQLDPSIYEAVIFEIEP